MGDEASQHIQHLYLVMQIQKCRRFVQQDDICLLRERHGDPRALALAAGEAVDCSFGKA
ncbi:hypothetical protein D3C80_1937480 [compost metagenome]